MTMIRKTLSLACSTGNDNTYIDEATAAEQIKDEHDRERECVENARRFAHTQTTNSSHHQASQTGLAVDNATHATLCRFTFSLSRTRVVDFCIGWVRVTAVTMAHIIYNLCIPMPRLPHSSVERDASTLTVMSVLEDDVIPSQAYLSQCTRTHQRNTVCASQVRFKRQ